MFKLGKLDLKLQIRPRLFWLLLMTNVLVASPGLAKIIGAQAYLEGPTQAPQEAAPSWIPPTPAKATAPKRDLTWQGKTSQPVLALTFDDGPKPVFAQSILDILDRYKIKATFFVVGQQALWHPDLVYQIAADGHELANHSYFHSQLDNLRQREVIAEIKATDEVIRAITGQTTKYFRPPGGHWDQAVLSAVDQAGLRSIGWSINAGDYFRKIPGQAYLGPDQARIVQIKEKVISQLKAGSIILMHNGGDETKEVLPAVIEAARSRGFRFVLLSELLAGQNKSLAKK